MTPKPLLFLILTVPFLLVSCSNTTAPDNLMDEERYMRVFSELVVINQLTEDQLGPVSRDYLREQVFEKYGVTSEQFVRSHQYYQQQPEQQSERIDKIEDLLTDERDMFQERVNRLRKEFSDSLSRADSLSMSGENADTLSLPDTLEKPDDIIPQ